MAKFKFNRSYSYNDIDIPKGSIVEGSIGKDKYGGNSLNFNLNGTNANLNVDFFKGMVSEVPSSTPLTSIAGGKKPDMTGKQLTDKQAGNLLGWADAIPVAMKRIQVLSLLGAVGGLGYAYKKGSGVGGYLGWSILFSLIGTTIAIASVKIMPPKTGKFNDKLKDELKKQYPTKQPLQQAEVQPDVPQTTDDGYSTGANGLVSWGR